MPSPRQNGCGQLLAWRKVLDDKHARGPEVIREGDTLRQAGTGIEPDRRVGVRDRSGDDDLEGGSAILSAAVFDRTAESLRQGSGNVEAQSCALGSRGIAGPESVLEDIRLIGLWNTDTGV